MDFQQFVDLILPGVHQLLHEKQRRNDEMDLEEEKEATICP